MISKNQALTYVSLPRRIKNLPSLFFCVASLTLAVPSYSSDRYFLCGGDEDGCFEGMHEYCECIPYNELEANNPYCIDDRTPLLKCLPLSEVPTCKAPWIFKNQGECVAALYQSEPTPPCEIITHAQCLEGHTPICSPDAELDSCH